VTYLGFDVREWFRSTPLRREWKARAVSFRTELDWVRYQPDGDMKRMEIFVRGDMSLVTAGAIPRSDGPARRDRLLP
jgi:hypothetical protein